MWYLQTRAIIIFGFYSTFRLVQFLFGMDLENFDPSCDDPEVIER